jgi:hypothetical protein
MTVLDEGDDRICERVTGRGSLGREQKFAIRRMLREGQLGVHPPGALGVAFFVHAAAECFIGRAGDGITQPLKDAGAFNLDDQGKLRRIAMGPRIFGNLLEAEARGGLPELLLVCCNPDQVGLFTGELTRFLENLAERDRLRDRADV